MNSDLILSRSSFSSFSLFTSVSNSLARKAVTSVLEIENKLSSNYFKFLLA